MDLRQLAADTIAMWDAKARRVNRTDVIFLGPDVKSIEVRKQLDAQLVLRPKGRYEYVGLVQPSLDDVAIYRDDDESYDKHFEQFDTLMAELAGKWTLWAVSTDHPDFSEELAGLIFSES